jgi:hypothetical protein
MRTDIQQLEYYLDQTLGEKVTPTPWPGEQRLAPFLRDRYSFWEVWLLHEPCLLMIDGDPQEPAAGMIRKHVDQVRDKYPDDVIYVRQQIASYNRKRLMEKRTPFIMPGTQMYLPTTGLDFRRHAKRPREVPKTFSPATQATLIFWLLRGSEEPITPHRMKQELGYSPMTMTRAFDELEDTEVGEVARRGKERRLQFIGPKRDVWQRALRYLKSPVTKRVCVPRPAAPLDGFRAGLDALAEYSMLEPPRCPVVAFWARDWNALGWWHNKASISKQDPDAIEIEAWSYKPKLLTEQNFVDPLSLYLSLRDHSDERVQMALEHMIEEHVW